MTNGWQCRTLIGFVLITCLMGASCTRLPRILNQETAFTDAPVDVSVVGFNVESGDANPAVIAEQYVGPLSDVDVWGFSEVQNAEWLRLLEQGAESGEQTDFQSILGTSGGGDRLAVVYNPSLLRVIHQEELDALSFGGRVRASLIVHFQVRRNGQEFLFMVNHLYRSQAERRHEQAQMLNAWAQRQALPIIAVGDYNFDFDVVDGDQGKRDRGFDLLLDNDVFRWVRPDVLVASHCSDRYDSILDFTFVGNQAMSWTIKDSAILFATEDSTYCPDDALKSDHRPVITTFEIPSPP